MTRISLRMFCTGIAVLGSIRSKTRLLCAATKVTCPTMPFSLMIG
ncbi:Uncharacterised protein [Vibrio cholerae]|nr:Uncharacterised protein [Vibrio cholerae]